MSLKKNIASVFYKITDVVYSFFPNRSRVIIYHHLDEISVVNFEKNIRFLLKKGYKFLNAYSFAELLFKEKSKINNELFCAITFDDGFDSVINFALPILKKYNINATIFVNLKLHELVQNDHETREFTKRVFPRISEVYPNLKGVTAQEVTTLKSNGIEIGGHTYSHPNLGLKADYDLEFEKPRQYFEETFDISLNTFAYPYGRKRNYNKQVIEELRFYGYKYAFLGISKNPLKFTSTEYEIPRTSIPVNCSNIRLNALMRGSQDLFDKLLNENRDI